MGIEGVEYKLADFRNPASGHLRLDIAGLQTENVIYFNRFIFADTSRLLTPRGLFVFGHEVAHVYQYRADAGGFAEAYAKDAVPFEKQADEVGAWFRDMYVEPGL